MDLRQLRYFVRVVEHGNVTRASEALHIAQPAVSQQIRSLEQDLGMQLLTRSVHGVKPTAAGQTLYRHALDLLRQADSTRELLRQDAETPQGKVSVAMPSSTSRLVAIPLARMIRDRYPGIMLELIEAPSADLPGLLSNRRVALAVVTDAVETPSLALQPLLTEELYLMVWPEFALSSNKVSIAELAQMPLVMPSAPNSIRSRVEWALREHGRPCEILFEASSTSLLFAAVMARLGVTVLPWSAAYLELREHKLKMAKVDHPQFTRELSLSWHRVDVMSNAVQKVKAAIIELTGELRQRPEWARQDDQPRPH
ncbi:LysR substrate-binding domain-containing protein [Pseudomonas wadenswilerensis]|uniref:LysR substrate-binding domain-containing protein n=1 Tax=Pseudomonas wadenswilerensis TaxID=1785161 RepID=UPI00215E56CF|nr:LysR substrate-binding domain-containing protein [Pseudomonas wadenswilerensis]UVM24440.1 LysR substrate-binding domain-containing protein [Pseudomonas wadenswilerensis]